MGFKEEMLCSKSHEYIVKEGDKYVIGLTDYAIEQLGDIVFLELPEVGDEFKKEDTFVNSDLVDAPEKLNEDCYENGWLVKVESDASEDEFKDLMSYADYKEELE